MAHLGRRFAQFRKEHRRGARVPMELRRAVLAGLKKVPPGDLYRTCGVTFRQVMAWKTAATREIEPPEVRVFEVVEDEEATRWPPPTVSGSAQQLEVRIGPWAVSVRLMADEPARRGGACCR